VELIPLSALNHYLYCPRRAALIHVEGIFEENEHTIRGELTHEHADLPGYEVAKGVLLWRALPIWSERLGLSGKCDIVERQPDGALYPVEFKIGKRRRWENDDVQLCAQALCLEEMFGVRVLRGAIFHADSKRRREVEFSAELRSSTESAVADVRQLLELQIVPPAVFKPACEECSLFHTCLPKATSTESRAGRLSLDLFKT
jgi:CRISPR-associated exonuclease Cas4